MLNSGDRQTQIYI